MLYWVTAASASFEFSNGQAAAFVIGQADLSSAEQRDTEYPQRFGGPYSLAVDPTSKKIFVADTLGSRILRFASLADLTIGAEPEAVLGKPNLNVIGLTQSGIVEV